MQGFVRSNSFRRQGQKGFCTWYTCKLQIKEPRGSPSSFSSSSYSSSSYSSSSCSCSSSSSYSSFSFFMSIPFSSSWSVGATFSLKSGIKMWKYQHLSRFQYVACCPTRRNKPFLTAAEKEPGGELRWGQRGGDPGEQALHRWPRRLGPIHPQGLPHWHAHSQLVSLHPAQSSAEGGRGVMERLPLHSHQVSVQPPQPQQWVHPKCFSAKIPTLKILCFCFLFDTERGWRDFLLHCLSN